MFRSLRKGKARANAHGVIFFSFTHSFMVAMSQEQIRATRIRDNKRRFRLRQKEYLADLEQSLRELKQQGVQATKEVQLSARRVVRENLLLRQLLRSYGANDRVIDDWVRRHKDTEFVGGNAPVCAERCINGFAQGKRPEIVRLDGS